MTIFRTIYSIAGRKVQETVYHETQEEHDAFQRSLESWGAKIVKEEKLDISSGKITTNISDMVSLLNTLEANKPV